MNKKFDLAVFIGRFQPLHKGHEEILHKCIEIADTTLVIIGSSTAARSIRNPFTLQERVQFFRVVSPPDVNCRGVPDSAYNFHEWLINVKQTINDFIKDRDNPSIAIVGHFKDDTSYYLNYFPEYTFVPVDTQSGGLGATAIRDQLFSNPFTMIEWETLGTSPAVTKLLKKWMGTESAKNLIEEYKFIQDYKRMWAVAPYPPTFVTTDAVVICLGHVLMIKRGRNPGKGLYALPGGFLEQTESVENGCLRELKEETHIDIPKKYLSAYIQDSHVFDHPLRDPRGRTITHAFLFDLDKLGTSTFPKVEADDDASEAAWIPLHKLEEYDSQIFGDHSQIIRYFLHRMGK